MGAAFIAFHTRVRVFGHLGSTWPLSSPFVLFLEEKGGFLSVTALLVICHPFMEQRLVQVERIKGGRFVLVKTTYSSDINLDLGPCLHVNLICCTVCRILSR